MTTERPLRPRTRDTTAEEAKIAKAFGRAAAIRGVVSLVAGISPLFVIAWLFGSSLVAGLIHEDLAAVTFWSQFLCFPFLAIGGGVGLGLFLRRIVLAPYRTAYDALGPSRRYLISGIRWDISLADGTSAEIRFLRRSLFFEVRGQPSLDLRGGRDNAIARAVRSEQWAVEQLDSGVIVLCKDREGLTEHLGRAEHRAAWETLLGNDGRSLRAVHVKPGHGATLSLRHVPYEALVTETASAWLDALAVLARA